MERTERGKLPQGSVSNCGRKQEGDEEGGMKKGGGGGEGHVYGTAAVLAEMVDRLSVFESGKEDDGSWALGYAGGGRG